MQPEEGQDAPGFTLKDQDGRDVALSSFKGKNAVVLFAYPKALTPGCTTECIDFTRLAAELAKHGAVAVGISGDSVETLKKFETKHELGIRLLSDPEKKVLTSYGFFGEKKMYGKVSQGIIRSTAIIGKDGRIARMMRNVKATGHAERVLNAVKELAAS